MHAPCSLPLQPSPAPAPTLTSPLSAPPPARLPACVQGLAGQGKLASLTVVQLTKYLNLHSLPTGGKKADVVARIAAHVEESQ